MFIFMTHFNPFRSANRSSFLRSFALPIMIFFGTLMFTGCAALLSSVTGNLADNLSQAIMNNNDLATVQAGAPAYLLMVDGLLRGDPKNESLLRSGASLYTAYTGVFVKDKERSQRLSDKALYYGFQALCVRKSVTCGMRNKKFNTFAQVIAGMAVDDVPALYSLGTSWAGWIQTRSDDFNAIAEISRVEVIMLRIVELDETYQDGGANLYLGVLATLIPRALGGKPKVGRGYFERAIELSGGKNLMAKVLYARHYARLMFDRKLHDRLLKETLKAEPEIDGYTLINTLAQKQAKELMESADDYF